MWALAPQITAVLRGSWSSHLGHGIRVKELVLQLCLGVLELGMLVLAVPLWMMLPGIVFATWLSTAFMMVWGLSWFLNGDVVVTCDGTGSWSMEPESEEERWIFVNGMGTRLVVILAF